MSVTYRGTCVKCGKRESVTYSTPYDAFWTSECAAVDEDGDRCFGVVPMDDDEEDWIEQDAAKAA